MSEPGLVFVFKAKDLKLPSLTGSACGQGTMFDFKSSDYLEKMFAIRT